MKQKKIVIVCKIRAISEKWARVLQEKAPEFQVEIYPDDTHREETEFILVFKPPVGVYREYPNLKVIAAMTAGVRVILTDPSLPLGITVTKVNDEQHHRDMSVFVLALALNYCKGLMRYTQQKAEKVWQPHHYLRPEQTTVGIMGLGTIGQEIGKLLAQNDFKVIGWSRTEKFIPGIHSFFGEDQKADFLKKSQILVCVLPLTDETENILNRKTFALLPEGAYVINVGRGAELVDEDLIAAIDSGHLSGAAIDAFREEPLPKEHPFWVHEKIMLTPHTAGITDPHSVLDKVLKNYEAMLKGLPLTDTVDVKKGY